MPRSDTNALSWCYPAAAGVQSECSKNLIAKVLADETGYRKEVRVYRNQMVRNLSRLKRETDEMRTNIRRLWERRKECRREGRTNYQSFESSQKSHTKRLRQRDKIDVNILTLMNQDVDGERSRRGSRMSRASVGGSLPRLRRPSTIARLSSINSVPEEPDIDTGVKSLDDMAILQVMSHNNQQDVAGLRTRRTAVTGVGPGHIPTAFELHHDDLQETEGATKSITNVVDGKAPQGDTSPKGNYFSSDENLIMKSPNERTVVDMIKPETAIPNVQDVPTNNITNRRRSRVRLSSISLSQSRPTVDRLVVENNPVTKIPKPKKTKPNEMSILHLVRLKESQTFSRKLSIVDRISNRIQSHGKETLAKASKRARKTSGVKSDIVSNMSVSGPYQKRLPPIKTIPAITIEEEDTVGGVKHKRASSSARSLPQLRRKSVNKAPNSANAGMEIRHFLEKLNINADGSNALEGGGRFSLSGVTAWRQEREDETLIVVDGTGGRRRSSRRSLPLTSHTLKMLRKDSVLDQGVSVTGALEKIRTCHYPASESSDTNM